MDSSLVIKVQYGDTLRRFNTRIIGNDNLDLDMVGLRAKIFNLFNIPSDAEVTLAYFDEDGDIVTLVDDDDLRDVMRQNLKYLKIIVSERVGRSYVRSSGSSTPLRSPSVQPPLLNVNAIVAEAFKSVPETLQGALSKISTDFISKASSTSPSVADLIEQLAKMGVGNLSAGSASASRAGESTSAVAPATAADGTDDTQMPTDVLPKVASTSVFKEAPISESLGATAAVAPSAGIYQQPIDLNSDPPVTLNLTTGVKGPQKYRKRDLVGVKPCGSSTSTCPPETQTTALMGNSTQATGYSHIFSPCPFSGVPLLNESSLPSHSMHNGKRGFKSTDFTGAVFHKGIRCDGCGILPITGPRYKSLVKEDYDLCRVCFEEKGRECDYIHIDKPISYRSMKLKHIPHPWVPPVLPPHVFRPGSKRGHPKLDSRFVSDVTIMDGTVMAPSTPFTKIWRMRNNGNFVWSAGTRLVWIGGDNFSKKNCVDIEIPALGVNVEAELDISLDFVAPASPGRYISYWRMASPSGHKFGQRVWVLIQVETSPDVSAPKIPGALNLNLPPETIGSILHEMNSQFGDGYDETLGQSSHRGVGKSASFEEFLGPSNPTRVGELEKLSTEKLHGKEQEDNFPINDALLVGNVGSTSTSPESSVSISYPVISPSDIGEIASSVSVPPTAPAVATEPVPVPVPVAEAESSAKGVMEASNSNDVRDESDMVEESLLKELAEMGFKQVDLNKEVLRMNSYDMEQSVEDLCGVSEWDPILEELQEMGFCDKEKNKRLLKKNDGSIRRVVMDLLTGESDDAAVTH